MWYLNVRSKADISRLNLPHGTKTKSGGKVKTDVLRRIGKQTGIRGFSPKGETEGYDGKDLQERKVLSLE